MATANGASIRYVRQSARGTYSNTTGIELLRNSAPLNEKSTKVENNQIRPDRQKAVARRGIRWGEGTIEDISTPGAHARFWESLTLGAFATAPTTGALTNVTAAVTASPIGTFTRAAGSFITDGFRKYDVVRCTGWAAPATANNTKNFLITNLTATVMTVYALDDSAVVAKAAGDSVTITLQGKRASIPASGHTDHWYQFEQLHADMSPVVSRRIFDAQIETGSIQFQPDANPIVTFGIKAISPQADGSSSYFSGVTAAPSTPINGSATGALFLNGAKVATITTATINVNAGKDMPKTVLTNSYPRMSTMEVTVSGTISIIWDDQTLMNAHRGETDLDGVFLSANGPAANADFSSWILPRFRLFEPDQPDSKETIVQTFQFECAENTAAATGSLASSFAYQDSLAP